MYLQSAAAYPAGFGDSPLFVQCGDDEAYQWGYKERNDEHPPFAFSMFLSVIAYHYRQAYQGDD